MSKISRFALAPVFLAMLAPSAVALARELSCDDIEFNFSATDEFPSVAQSCHSVVERDGKLYVRLVADVVRVRTDGSMMLEFKAADGSSFRQDLASTRSSAGN